ncbi:MAG: DUF2158 domain-containing protein [Rhodanobacteraceae bacterium]|nr:DUF2158 domain-containing protein [Rhodanobacteraceae bacterium]
MNVGDVVQSKAGGPAMVVAADQGDGSWQCTWWHPRKGTFRSHSFHGSTLVPYVAPTGSSTPSRGVRSKGLD